MPTLRPITIEKDTPFLGEDCALCKHPFAPGDEIVICPEDATRHHRHCWQANDNKCSAYGCGGQGLVLPHLSPRREAQPFHRSSQTRIVSEAGSKVRTLPERSFHLAQSCLIMAIAISIVLFAIGCFGLWAIADFIMIEILDWQYRTPIQGAVLPLIYFLWA